MTIMQLLVAACGILLAVVGFGGRTLINRMIISIDKISDRIDALEDRLATINQLNAIEIEKIHSRIEIIDRQCDWTHQRRTPAAAKNTH